MNRVLTAIICIALISFTACKKKKKDAEDEQMITIEMTEDTKDSSDIEKSEVSGDCDDFMDDYEDWMEKYVDLMTKYKDDPVSLASSAEYRAMSMEMMEWSSKWSSLAVDCASYPEYEERFNEIQKKVDKEMEALDLN